MLSTFSELADLYLLGMTTQAEKMMDGSVVPDVREHLFEVNPDRGGLDLSSFNIQRGRDHGLPGYNFYRDVCGSGSSGRADNFDEFSDLVQLDDLDALKRLYKDHDDVDLYVGGMVEKQHEDSMLGPTFTCLVGDVFVRFVATGANKSGRR
jgi:hypothetical protein